MRLARGASISSSLHARKRGRVQDPAQQFARDERRAFLDALLSEQHPVGGREKRGDGPGKRFAISTPGLLAAAVGAAVAEFVIVFAVTWAAARAERTTASDVI